MEHHHFVAGKIHYLDWAIFNSFLYVHQRVHILALNHTNVMRIKPRWNLAWFSPKELDWCGVFALALVRVGRHLEVKAINKAAPDPVDFQVSELIEFQSNPTRFMYFPMDSWFSHDSWLCHGFSHDYDPYEIILNLLSHIKAHIELPLIWVNYNDLTVLPHYNHS